MAFRISGRKLSFDVLSSDGGSSLDDEVPLYRSNSDPVPENGAFSPFARKRKNKGSKRKKKTKMMIEHSIEDIDEDPITEKQVDAVFFDGPQQHQRLRSSSSFGDVEDACVNGLKATDYQSYSYQTNTTVIEEVSTKTTVGSECDGSVRTVHQVSEEPPNPKPEPEFQIVRGDRHAFVELRQRNVSGSGAGDELSMVVNGGDNNGSVNEESFGELRPPAVPPKAEPNGDYVKKKLQTTESLDWKQIMAEDSTDQTSLEKSPLKYFTGEIYSGNSLRGTTTLGTEKERERVYDTLFRLPWRCELLIDVGFFVCFDSFLSLLTIMPTRILMTFWRLLNTWQFQMPSAAELSDFSCLIALACGVSLLQQVDISLIYHMIRGQGTIKLYVVYNVLEIFDKLCQNFGGDVFQTLFGSAKGLASSSPENINFWLWRFMSDQALTTVASIVHSFVLLAQAITLATCIVAHNNALLALLVSNNFAEIKSNVFKRYSKENVHSLVYFDSIERFHISAFILFVLAQNILEAEGSWFGSFLSNALLVFVCEMVIDVIKHSFIAKFNEIKPTAYSEFLEDLCKQTLNMQPEDGKKNLTFVPLAPACVVIRVLTPVYAAHLPCGPPLWRLLWVFILSGMTYLMLTSLKVMIGMGLQKHATWYVKRCQRRKHHLHYD